VASNPVAVRSVSRIKTGLAVAAILTGLASLGAYLYLHDQTSAVVRVLQIPGWHESKFLGTRSYEWVTDNVLFAGSTVTGLQKPFLYDTRLHRITRLTRLQQEMETENSVVTDSWELSPDRGWLLWKMDLSDRVCVARLDGSGFLATKVPRQENSVVSVEWQDNTRWRALCYDYSSRTRSTETDGNVSNPGPPNTKAITPIPIKMRNPELLDGIGENRISFVLPQSPSSNRQNGLRQILSPPDGTETWDAVMSNKRDRLAWLVAATRRPPFSNWVGTLVPSYATERTHYEVWISNLEGKQMRKIGGIEPKLAVNSTGMMGSLRWLPSDRAVSFVCEDSIWLVRVN